MDKKDIKLKVALGELKQIIPVLDVNVEIGALRTFIGQRFAADSIKQLQTVDGYILEDTDKVRDVLRDGESLIALELPAFINLYSKHIQWIPVEISRAVITADARTDRYIQAGWIPSLRKYFIRVVYDRATTHLELFPLSSFLNFAEGRTTLVHAGEKDQKEYQWEVSATILTGKDGPYAIELFNKSPSDPRAEIKRQEIKVTRSKVEEGPVTLIQSFQLPLTAGKIYSSELPVHEGPVYSDDGEEVKGEETPPDNLPTEKKLTQTYKEKDEQNTLQGPTEIFGWLQADDTKAKVRLYALAALGQTASGPQLVFEAMFPGTKTNKSTWKLDDVHACVLRAEKQQKTEYECEDLGIHDLETNNKITITALIDENIRRVYAFRFQIRTQTSSASQSFLIPWKF